MSVLNKITLENIKKNKKRTAVTIIGVALSAALICAVAGMVMSFRQSLINMAKEDTGNYHIVYQDVPQNQLKYIENNVNIESYFYSQSIGVAELIDSQNEYKPYANVLAFTDKALQNNGLKIMEGRLPRNEGEIAIPEHIISNGKIDWKIGDTITLNVGERKTIDGYELNQSNPFTPEGDKIDSEENTEETIVNTKTKSYKIVGIVERPNSILEPYSAPAYTVITYLSKENLGSKDKNYNIYVRFKEAKEFDTYSKQILKTIKNNTGKDISILKNMTLLEFEGALAENTLKAFYYLAAIIIAIILVSSVFVIRNSFSISVTEKTKQYGMLASVGATAKQIRKSVLFEGLIIGVIGIPLGMLLGIVAIVVLIQILNILLIDMLNFKFVYSIPPIVLFITVGVSSLTIFLSSIIPAIKAGRISPIEAIRGNSEIKIKAKKVKTSKLTKKIFGIGGAVASKNLKRSRRKYRTTVISLVVSVATFIVLSSFLDYGKMITGAYYIDMDYNISVYNGDINTYKEIIKKEGIEKSTYYRVVGAKVNVDKYGTDFSKKVKSDSGYSFNSSGSIILEEHTYKGESEDRNIYPTVYFMDRQSFEEFAKDNGIRTNDYSKIAILEHEIFESESDNSKTKKYFYNIKEGQELELTLIKDKEESENETITITKISEKRPRGLEGMYNIGGYIFVSEDYYNTNFKKTWSDGALYIKSTDAEKTEKEITDEKYPGILVTNVETVVKQMKRLILVVSIFLYGFIIVITLIGVTNIFNTITTNMILRSKEFAMLKSVGMTTKEFNRMIRLESIMYGLKSLITGIPIGLVGSYAIFKAFSNEINFGYQVPLNAILISVIFVFIIVGLTMKYSLSKINKQNIVERIRNDNI